MIPEKIGLEASASSWRRFQGMICPWPRRIDRGGEGVFVTGCGRASCTPCRLAGDWEVAKHLVAAFDGYVATYGSAEVLWVEFSSRPEDRAAGSGLRDFNRKFTALFKALRRAPLRRDFAVREHNTKVRGARGNSYARRRLTRLDKPLLRSVTDAAPVRGCTRQFHYLARAEIGGKAEGLHLPHGHAIIVTPPAAAGGLPTWAPLVWQHGRVHLIRVSARQDTFATVSYLSGLTGYLGGEAKSAEGYEVASTERRRYFFAQAPGLESVLSLAETYGLAGALALEHVRFYVLPNRLVMKPGVRNALDTSIQHVAFHNMVDGEPHVRDLPEQYRLQLPFRDDDVLSPAGELAVPTLRRALDAQLWFSQGKGQIVPRYGLRGGKLRTSIGLRKVEFKHGTTGNMGAGISTDAAGSGESVCFSIQGRAYHLAPRVGGMEQQTLVATPATNGLVE